MGDLIYKHKQKESWVYNTNFEQNKFKAVFIKHTEERRNGQTVVWYYICLKEQENKN